MLWGGFCVVARLGRKKKRARGARWEGWKSSPARFLFFRLFYFDGDTQREPLRRREGHSGEKREPASTANSVGRLWHSHGKNPVRLYPKLQSQPIGLPKIFIDMEKNLSCLCLILDLFFYYQN